MVLNGDSYCQFNVDELKRVHQQSSALATMWLECADDLRRFATVEISDEGQITCFREKSLKRKHGLINAGVYLFERKILEALPYDRAFSLETELFPKMVNKGLFGVVGNGHFLDIGTPESYSEADQLMDLLKPTL